MLQHLSLSLSLYSRNIVRWIAITDPSGWFLVLIMLHGPIQTYQKPIKNTQQHPSKTRALLSCGLSSFFF